MPNVAHTLCRDIVEPVLKRSSANAGRVKSTNKFSNSTATLKQTAKPTRYVHIERNTSSKSKTLHTDGATIFKSKTSIVKSLAEAAVNTLATGPLRCDNNCVTVVRKRDDHSTCKCGYRPPKIKCSAKSIQTMLKKDYSHLDKACTQCVQTATCGTQFINKISKQENKAKSKSNIALKLPGCTREDSSLDRCLNIQRNYCNHYVGTPSLRYITAKRWALSNYPTRGPDF